MMSFTSRSCRPEVFCKKGILSNFLGVLRNHLYQSLFLTKLQACNFIKKETLAQVFSVNFEKFLRIPFLTERLRWLLLNTLRLTSAIWKLFVFFNHAVIQKNNTYSKNICKKQVCLYSWDYAINYIEKENENEKIDHIDTTQIIPRCRHEHKFSKYKKCLTMTMLVCIKEQLCNIWSSIHEKVATLRLSWKKALLMRKKRVSIH